MHFPKPLIDVDSAAREVIFHSGEPWERPGKDDSWPQRDKLQQLLANAWEEGRRSPPGACMNPYGETTLPEFQEAAPLTEVEMSQMVVLLDAMQLATRHQATNMLLFAGRHSRTQATSAVIDRLRKAHLEGTLMAECAALRKELAFA